MEGFAPLSCVAPNVPRVKTRSETFVWFDIFCVNQHLKSPGCWLLLSSQTQSCNQTVSKCFWKPGTATLSRVWCLDELRVAMLHWEGSQNLYAEGSDGVISPAKEANTQTIKDIDKVVQRTSIEHASATFQDDRDKVFANIDETVGQKALDTFAKETMRKPFLLNSRPRKNCANRSGERY